MKKEKRANNKADKADKVYIYGRHATLEALSYKPEVIKSVFLADQDKESEIVQVAGQNNIPIKQLGKGESRLAGQDAVHQGIIAVMDPSVLFTPWQKFVDGLDIEAKPAIALCAEVQDPHNLGAIIRSAAALGLSGVIIPEHRQAPLTGTVVKTSVGMVFKLPIVSVGNVNQTLRELQERGFWVYGLDMEGEKLTETSFDRPSVFVVGNEGGGIREKTLELCDHRLSIPMHPRAESLNAAVSAATVFYEWSRQHPESLK